MRRIGAAALALGSVVLMAVGDAQAAVVRYDAEAVRLNNRGVAQMGQQFTEKAADTFAAAMKKDPKLAQAAINEGVALMTLQKLDEAKKALQAAIALDPNSAQAWYNLGLAQHAGNELEPALKSFQQAVKADPRDADSYYFEGVCDGELKDFDEALDVLQQALTINPLDGDAGRGAGGRQQGDDCGEAGGAGFGWRSPTLAAKKSAQQGWGTHGVDDNGRRLHDGRDWRWTYGPGADAGGAAGDSCAACHGQWEL